MKLCDVLKGLCAQARQAIYNAIAEGDSSDVTNARLACAALRDVVDEQVPELCFKLNRLKPDEFALLCKQSGWLSRWPSARKVVIAWQNDVGSDTDPNPTEGPAPDPSTLAAEADAVTEWGDDIVLDGLVAQMDGVQELSIEGLAFSAGDVQALLEALPPSVVRCSVDEVGHDASRNQDGSPTAEPEAFAVSCTLACGKVVSLEVCALNKQYPWPLNQGEWCDTDFDDLVSFMEALLPPSRVPQTQPRSLSTSLAAPAGQGMPRFGPKFLDLVSRCEETRLEELEPEVFFGRKRASVAAVLAAAERLGVPHALRWRWWWAPRHETIRVALRPPGGTRPAAPCWGRPGSGNTPIDAPGVVRLAVQRMLTSYAPGGVSSGAEASSGCPPQAEPPCAPSRLLLTGSAIAALVGAGAGVNTMMWKLEAAVVAECRAAASGAAGTQQQAPVAAPAAAEAEAVQEGEEEKEDEEEEGEENEEETVGLLYRELPCAGVIELSCASEEGAAALQRLVVPFMRRHVSAAVQAAAAEAERAADEAAAAALREAGAGDVEAVPCLLDVTQAIAETLEALWAGEEAGAPSLALDGLGRLRWLLGVWEELLHEVPYLRGPGWMCMEPGGERWRGFPGGMRVRRLGLCWV